MKFHACVLPLTLVAMTAGASACDVLSLAGDTAGVSKSGGEDLVCLLSGTEYANQVSEALQLMTATEEIREHTDGYALRFPGDEVSTERLMRFVRTERQCCDFFKFELTFEPRGGPIWLYIGGSAQAKAFVESIMK